ncbi:hypothetical protein ORL36_16400 [Klebsiella pasteurii]|uniref:hypothetical protein n=1 Tax=Klebsiella pasteurii TaxID=2587529 RepID=UPI002247DEB4|nr:hypothetical protein [Klebsiella pasteurii]MCW9586197.1 hypothetical protein [Klebsiella pasteurii]
MALAAIKRKALPETFDKFNDGLSIADNFRLSIVRLYDDSRRATFIKQPQHVFDPSQINKLNALNEFYHRAKAFALNGEDVRLVIGKLDNQTVIQANVMSI